MSKIDLDKVAPVAGTLLPGTVRHLRARAAGTSPPVPLPWGPVAAALRGGLWPGLHVLAGAPGTGKTQFTVQVAVHAAQHGTPVLYASLELCSDEMVSRLLGAAGGFRWSDAWTGDEDAVEELRAACALPWVAKLPIRLWVPPKRLSTDRLRMHVAAFVDTDRRPPAGRTPPLVVVDYLQRLSSRKRGGDEDPRGRVGQAAYAARGLARDLGVAVLLVSSVSREHYKRSGGDPTDYLGVGKESGDVEFSADTIAALVSDVAGGPASRKLQLAKVRYGTPATCDLLFDGASFTAPTTKALT